MSNDSSANDSVEVVKPKAEEQNILIKRTEKSVAEAVFAQRPDQTHVSNNKDEYLGRDVPVTWNDVSQGSNGIRTFGDGLKRSSSAILARRSLLNDVKRPLSSMATDVTSNCDVSLKSKR